ncbi:MAG: chain-length determining protein, partial [Bacteroidaceae bacterium]|nr:chain-length determining protein [Bacteroidaceae bacterium]
MSNKTDYIDLRVVVRELLSKKKTFVWTWVVTAVVASVLIVCVPRTYTCSVKLAPEAESAGAGGALGSIASQFGFDLG